MIAFVCIFLATVLPVIAQPVTMLVECNRGVSYVSNAAYSSDGRAIVVGDLGRMGVISQSDREFTWHCLPEQTFLFDAWIEHDSLVVVGENGAVWWRKNDGIWKNIRLPASETCRAVAKQGSTFYVGTEEGSIWKCTELGQGTWTRNFAVSSSILDIYADDSTLVAVGTGAGLYVWSSIEDRWIDNSTPSSGSIYSTVRSMGASFIIGADSGQVIRFDRMQNTVRVSKLFRPSPYRAMPDFRGSSDRTLSICSVPSGELVASGYYYDGGSSAVGVYVSSDTGSTWIRKKFYDMFSQPDLFNAGYCPLAFVFNEVLTVVSASLGAPIVIYRSTNLGSTWNTTQAFNFYQQIAVENDTVPHYFVDGVTGVDIIRESMEYLTTQCQIPMEYEDLYTIPTRTLVQRRLRRPGGVVETNLVSTLPGRFYNLQRTPGRLHLTGDSNRVAMSLDEGQTWQIQTLDSTRKSVLPPRSLLFLGEHRIAIGYNSLYFSHSGSTVWSALKISRNSTEDLLAIDAIQINYDEVAVLVSAYQGTTKLRSIIYSLRYASDSVIIDSVASIPDSAYTNPSLFMSGDTISMMMSVIESVIVPNGRQLRCTLSSGQWQCDTARIETKSGTAIPFIGAEGLIMYQAGSLLICSRFNGSVLQSSNAGRTWKQLPWVRTGFTGPPIAIAASGNELVLVGTKYYFASIQREIPSGASDESDKPRWQLDASGCQDSWDNDVIESMTVHSVSGTQCLELHAVLFDEAESRVKLLANGVYRIHAKTAVCEASIIVLVANGEMYRTTTEGIHPQRR